MAAHNKITFTSARIIKIEGFVGSKFVKEREWNSIMPKFY